MNITLEQAMEEVQTNTEPILTFEFYNEDRAIIYKTDNEYVECTYMQEPSINVTAIKTPNDPIILLKTPCIALLQTGYEGADVTLSDMETSYHFEDYDKDEAFSLYDNWLHDDPDYSINARGFYLSYNNQRLLDFQPAYLHGGYGIGGISHNLAFAPFDNGWVVHFLPTTSPVSYYQMGQS